MSAPTINGSSASTFDLAQGRNSRGDEQALIGAMLIASPDSAIPAEVRDQLRPGDGGRGVGEHHFTFWVHQEVWKTVIALMSDGRPHDALAVAAAITPEQLNRLGGVPYLHTCIQACPTVANATWYARNVVNATLLRGLAENAARTAQQVLTAPLDDAEEVYDRVRHHLGTLELPGRSGGPVAWEAAGAEALTEMERLSDLAQNPELGQAEFTTGWPDLDRLLSPVVPGALIIIAGRPGMAKSTAARNVAQHLAMRKNLPALFFSLEMSRLEIALAMMSCGARLRSDDIKHGTLADEDWVEAARYLGQTSDAPLEIDETAGANLAYIDRQLASFVRRYGRAPAAFFVDYVQLSDEHGHGNRQEAVSAMSRGYKLLAKKYGTVCVLISQLSRGPEGRADKRPQLSDLRESGSLEQDADIVILLYREDYYDKESPRAGEIDFIVAKHRNGPTDTITLAALLHQSRIASMAII